MLAGAAAAAAVSMFGCGARRRPDVLFVAIDDLNDWTSCLGGHPQARTPNLDRLAARGTLFANAHCNVPLCGGARTALLTGLAPSTTGIYTNHVHFRDVVPDARTLPQRFKDAGYRVLGTGKIFHLQDQPSWDEFYIPQIVEPTPPPGTGFGLGRDDLFDWGPLEGGDDDLGDGLCARWSAERLRREGTDQPLFLGLGLIRPHLPWHVPRPYFEAYPPAEVALPAVRADDTADLPVRARNMIRGSDHRAVVAAGQWHHAVAAYLASIAYMDAMLGRVVDALEERRRSGQEVVVVVWSDHGWHLGEKGHWRKFTLWERSTRVPLIIEAPSLGRPGSLSTRAVSLLDVFPTLLEVCGLPVPTDLEGTSLCPLLEDPEARREIPALTWHGPGAHTVRTDRWRFTRYLANETAHELYDHDLDPNEWDNLAGRPQHSELEQELAAWFPSAPAAAAPNRERG